jgi:hypothetical protein
MVFLLERHDLVAHHRPDGGDERTDFFGCAEIHVFLPRIGWRDMTPKRRMRQARTLSFSEPRCRAPAIQINERKRQ